MMPVQNQLHHNGLVNSLMLLWQARNATHVEADDATILAIQQVVNLQKNFLIETFTLQLLAFA